MAARPAEHAWPPPGVLSRPTAQAVGLTDGVSALGEARHPVRARAALGLKETGAGLCREGVAALEERERRGRPENY